MHLFMQKVLMLKYEDSTTLKTYFYNFVVSDNTVNIIAEQYISLLVAQHAQITCCQAKLGILNALNVFENRRKSRTFAENVQPLKLGSQKRKYFLHLCSYIFIYNI